MNKEKIAQKLFNYFSPKKDIILVYLFGSTVSGDFHTLSDIDVAILLKNIPSDPLEYRIFTTTELSKLLDVDKIDIVLLNDAPPRLKFEVVQNGELVYVSNDDARCDFEVHSRQEYFDVKPLLDLQYEYMRKRLKEGKFGVKLIKN